MGRVPDAIATSGDGHAATPHSTITSPKPRLSALASDANIPLATPPTTPQVQTASDTRLRNIPQIVHDEYAVLEQLGEGSFGVIFAGKHMYTNREVAIKFELIKADVPQLRNEWRTYKHLENCEGFPVTYYYGQEKMYNALVLDRLGHSLESLFTLCERRFSVKTVCMVAKQMIARVATLHEKWLIYYDIKPDNFMTGREGTPQENTIHMIDFGMAKHYRNLRTHLHIENGDCKPLSGTPRYMSINTHLGRKQSRRDDLEALGYVFMYFLRGSLPWQNLRARNSRQKYDLIGETKQATSIDKLTERCPQEFAEYLRYARNLAFEEEPDYKYLIGLMDQCLKSRGLTDDKVFDWCSRRLDKAGTKTSANAHISAGKHSSALAAAGLTAALAEEPAKKNNSNAEAAAVRQSQHVIPQESQIATQIPNSHQPANTLSSPPPIASETGVAHSPPNSNEQHASTNEKNHKKGKPHLPSSNNKRSSGSRLQCFLTKCCCVSRRKTAAPIKDGEELK